MISKKRRPLEEKIIFDLKESEKNIEKERKIAFKKMINAFLKDENLISEYFANFNKSFNVQQLASLAGDHLFDDYPERFGISKHEGQIIREYFQGEKPYKYVKEIHKKFPRVFEKESNEFMKYLDSLKNGDSLYLNTN